MCQHASMGEQMNVFVHFCVCVWGGVFVHVNEIECVCLGWGEGCVYARVCVCVHKKKCSLSTLAECPASWWQSGNKQ